MKTIRKWIDESDVYMLILGGRYGSIDEESDLSYTELEYKYALSKNMPVFAIILEDSFLFTKVALHGRNAIFEKENVDKYETFKKFVMSKIIKKADDISSIKTIIHSMLNSIIYDDEYILNGWVKANEPLNNLHTLSDDVLYSLTTNTLQEVLLRHYPFDTSDLCKTLSNKILYSLNFEEILDSSHY